MNCLLLAKGEKSQRLGVVKSFLKLKGSPLIELTLEKLSGRFAQIYLITTTPEKFIGYENFRVRVLVDKIKCGPLGGIYLGLKASDTAYNFVLAVDQIFIPTDFITWMMRKRKDYQVLVPRTNGQVHPLCAIYHQSVQEAMERRIKEGKYRLTDLLKEVETRYLKKGLEKFGPPERLFFNINTPADLIQARNFLNRT